MAGSELSRKERERLAHRNEILDAAERVFVARGYDGATVEQVAQEADFAVGTLYNFFDSKAKLLEEVMMKLARHAFTLAVQKVFNDPDPKKALDALIELRLRPPKEHRDFGRVLIEMFRSAPGGFAGSLPDSCREIYARYTERVVGIIKKRTGEVGYYVIRAILLFAEVRPVRLDPRTLASGATLSR